ncbi:MAG: hypothetical protein ACHQNV_05090 [Vicinamibacteria bacterium]
MRQGLALSGIVLSLVAAAPSPSAGSPREVELGLENFAYATAETPLNRQNVLGLNDPEDLLRLAGGWKESIGGLRLVVRGYVQRDLSAGGATTWTARQAYLQYGWGSTLQVRLGKQRIAWGSGFAWNPTNRLEPPKNAFNTGLEQEGSLAARLDWIPSSRAGVILIATRAEAAGADLPLETHSLTRTSGSGRLRLLVKDTDLALVVTAGKNQRTLLGFDAARDIGAQVTAHAEGAFYRGAELQPPRNGQVFFRVAAGLLRSRDTTSLSLEYFYNGEGYGDTATRAYLAGLDILYAGATDPSLPPAAREEALGRYLAGASVPYSGGLGLRRHYLQASWVRSEIRGKWSLSAQGLFALSDGGLALTPGVSFAPRGNVTLQLDGIVLLGPADSEYRLAPVRGALQSRVKVLF